LENETYRVAIGIPTYKRPLMLKKLILSILKNNINSLLINEINIIVVDNDIDKSAEKITNELKNEFCNTCKLNYHSYPEKGLANVRNEIFRQAFEFNPNFIACIDDDEYASPEWVNQLVSTIAANEGDIVMGPVIPIFETQVSPYISYWFKNRTLNNNQKVIFFETCNFIISTKFLLNNKVDFDCRFNSTGGEDSYFGITALKKGAKIFWASKALIYETIPTKRASLRWLLKRSFRYSNTRIYILFLEKKYLLILKKILVKMIYFIAGLFSLVLLPFQIKFKYWGPINIAESIGTFTGIVNIKYHEYKKDTKI